MDVKKAEELGAKAPKLTAENMKEINALYPAYIFRRRKTRELWTSCCGRHEVFSKKTYSAEIAAVMAAEHRPEPRKFGNWSCHCGAMSAPEPEKPIKLHCPYCGQEVTVKELGRTGSRKNLTVWRRFVVFKVQRGALWAVAYSGCKLYEREEELTGKPALWQKAVYRFKPGEAVSASKSYYSNSYCNFTQMKGRPKKLPLAIGEPFTQDALYGMGYNLIARDEVGKSSFRYCGFEEYEHQSNSIMRFLTVCAIYPRQVEMLMKAGLCQAVRDLTEGKKWNAAAFDWEEPNPLKAFGLSKPELQEFLRERMGLNMLAQYKQLRRAGIPCELQELQMLDGINGALGARKIIPKLKKWKLSPKKWFSYIERERKLAKGRKKYAPPARDVAIWWNDYIDAALVLGYNLKNTVFLLPKDLSRKHDEATKTASAILESRRSEDQKKAEQKRIRALAPRYTFSTERWLIRPPLGAAEIVAEGKALHHCVGGYADRHVSGKTTILFLRDRADTRKPLVTIEMKGNTLVQVHGWDDERTACKENPKRKSPRKLYAEILDPFLAWVEEGSKRDQKGYPVVSKKKTKKEVSAA